MFRFTIRDVLWFTMVAALGVGSQHAEAEDAAFDYRNAIRAATATLEKEHYTRRKLDNDLSAKWLTAFVASLDPRRMYFLQSDIADFEPFEHLLDDHAKTGDFQFPELVRTRYRERVAAATADAIRFIDAEHDFTIDESLPVRFEQDAKTPDELRERWRLRIKGELLVEKAHGRPLVEVQTQLRGRYERIAKQSRELSDAQLCEIFLDSLTKLYDPHSAFFGEAFAYDSPAFGLGIRLRDDAGFFVISAVWDRSVAADDRTLSLIGWELIAIRRTDGTILDLVETLPSEKAIEIIRSPFGPLKSDNRVVLELLHPVTLQRKSLEWARFRYY